MRTIKILFISIFLFISLFARPYSVPVGSSDNTISLTINNQGFQDIQELHVVPENIPEFIEINQLDNSNSIIPTFSHAFVETTFPGFSISDRRGVSSTSSS